MAVTVGLVKVVGAVSWPYPGSPSAGSVSFIPSGRNANGTLATIGQVDGVLNTTTMLWEAPASNGGGPLYVYGVASGQPVPYAYTVVERLYDANGVEITQTFQAVVMDQGSGQWNYNSVPPYPTSTGLIVTVPGASLNPRGVYASGTTYNKLDVVTSAEGRSFISLVTQTGNQPPTTATSTTAWQLNADKGSASGDMLKSVYDTNADGVVDNAAALGGTAAANYARLNALANFTAGLQVSGSAVWHAGNFTPGNYLLASTRGAVNGVASLDASGQVPASQLANAAAPTVISPGSAITLTTTAQNILSYTLPAQGTYLVDLYAVLQLTATGAVSTTVRLLLFGTPYTLASLTNNTAGYGQFSAQGLVVWGGSTSGFSDMQINASGSWAAGAYGIPNSSNAAWQVTSGAAGTIALDAALGSAGATVVGLTVSRLVVTRVA